MTAKVLNVITGLNVGGAEIMLARFLANLDRQSFAPRVLSLLAPGPIADQIERLGVDIFSAKLSRSELAKIDLGGAWRSFSDCDLAHGWMYHGNLAAVVMGLASRTPVIWSVHHSLHDIANEKPSTTFVIRSSAKLSSLTSAISYCSKVSAQQHEAIGFDSRKSVVIPNGVDTSVFKPVPGARARLKKLADIPDHRLLIGNVARFHPMKDQVRLVEALSLMRQARIDVHAVFLGAGHENNIVRETAQREGVSDYVTILPARAEIAELLPAFDVFALSSAWGEAFSLALTEAMACGVPSVATDVGDSSWIINDTQRIARPADAASIASVISRLIQLSAEERRQIGLRDRSRIVENFGISDYVRKHTELYDRALKPRPEMSAKRRAP